ncbi:ATP-dependent RecD-like DNA helicase [Paraburkholderia ultramafica]|uniref:ATP-dependent RecD-like DNA helicase n=1 Tax=Paraburkholderia ultramafica TaxID=1544867 RepID=A0A6S7C780_9BURK|nr:MobF family relaxase [Paraburkholderia ultramafica]CAB3802729.1 ATP-dependent RecD-like DNA helicase [Paraburkholderia ultramafica]
MLSAKVMTRQDIGRAASYYEDGADDYYAKEVGASEWQGEGAAILGLAGPIDPARFRQLLAGQVAPGIRVSRGSTRGDAKERIGVDLTFSAPKSVSIQALVAGDARVLQAHDRAVAAAVTAAEEKALVRRKVHGKAQVEKSGNLIVAKFRHETSRERDPQLHTHAVVMNLTRRSDGEWRALKNDEIVKSVKHLGAIYRAELAAELQALGYQLRHERDGMFELAHISPAQLAAFSQRSHQIEERLAAQGLNRAQASPMQKQLATMQTRARKGVIDRDAVFKDWQSRARELGIDFQRREWKGESIERRPPVNLLALPGNAAERAVRFAVNHLTERQAVITERELIDVAMKHGVGNVRMKQVDAEIRRQTKSGFLIRETPLFRPAADNGVAAVQTRSGWIATLTKTGMVREAARARVDSAIREGRLLAVDGRFTTQTALGREKRILQIERDGRGRVLPIIGLDAAAERLATARLNAGQREAALLLATSQNRIIGVQGFAGTGKTHMLQTARDMVEVEGYKVRALAPYGSQVKALRESGVTANTLASFLRAKDKDLGAKTVLVIDEAGVVPTRLMEQTLKLAEKAGARVVLVGDTGQTKAIEAGRPFDQLQNNGMETARMTEIQRQKDPLLKAAVELAAHGKTSASLEKIAFVSEIRNDGDRRAQLVRDYMELSPAERDGTLIVSGTNEARRAINQGIREAIGTAGSGIEFDTLVRRDSTQAERRFSKNYEIGDVIQPEQDYRSGLKRGELYTIVDTGPGNRLTVTDKDGVKIAYSPAQHARISVYQPERSELAAGDVVRITRNDAGLDLANGDRFRVAAVEARKIVLESDRKRVELSTVRPLHLDHAYATTVHSAQGLTADRVLIDAKTQSRTTAKDVYYVAISRARQEARIYTNDIRSLPAAIARENPKHTALDLTRERRALERERA